MIPNPDDTIIALASAAGPGRRGIVRLSGPNAHATLASVSGEATDSTAKRKLIRGRLRIPGIHSPLPADLYISHSPHTYTGQDTAEIHTISSPPLLDALIAVLLNAGARAALPGEFTLRAFLNGKKDLPQAEAVLGIIEAGSPDELKQALGQLAGGVTLPLHQLRDDLLNLLADIEAGLDFTDEDIQFVEKKDILMRLSKGLAQLMNLRKQLDARAVNNRLFRVALIGRPNAGKSSLFNVLAGLSAAIVSAMPGTTRDYIARSVPLGDISIELIDTAGWQQANSTIEEQAQTLGSAQAASADLLLWCVETTDDEQLPPRSSVPVLKVRTKSDLHSIAVDGIRTSVVTGDGVTQLKERLATMAREFNRPALAPSLSRCQHHVDAALKNLRAAHSIVLFDDPAELLALELRLALEQIGQMIGAVYTDDLLDRIFSRFCIGK